MKTLFLNLILFPVDLIYFSCDLFRVVMDGFVYASTRPEHDQPCIHCKNEDCGYRPRRLPAGLKKYRNQWVGCCLQPCVRGNISRSNGKRYACYQDGGFVKYPGWIRLFLLLMLAFWVGVFLILKNLFF